MRSLLVAGCVCLLTACSQPQPAAAGVDVTRIDPASLVGTWSFDRTCASDDGMTLNADGIAGTDQGNGMWAVDAGQRLILIIREQEMGVEPDPNAPRQVWTFTAAKPIGDDLVGRMEAVRAGETPRPINAKRCRA